MLSNKQKAYLAAMEIPIWCSRDQPEVIDDASRPAIDTISSISKDRIGPPGLVVLIAHLRDSSIAPMLVAKLSLDVADVAQRQLFAKIAQSIAGSVEIIEQGDDQLVDDKAIYLADPLPSLAQMLEDGDQKQRLWAYFKSRMNR